jgi:hypothetical protein
MKSVSVGHIVTSMDSGTQSDESEVKTKTYDKEVWVRQSPGAISRHIQTNMLKSVDQ